MFDYVPDGNVYVPWSQLAAAHNTDDSFIHTASTEVQLNNATLVNENVSVLLDETNPLETNATGGCLAYHTKNTKRMNVYGSRSLLLPDVGNFYYQALQVIMVQPCLPSQYAARNYTTAEQ